MYIPNVISDLIFGVYEAFSNLVTCKINNVAGLDIENRLHSTVLKLSQYRIGLYCKLILK